MQTVFSLEIKGAFKAFSVSINRFPLGSGHPGSYTHLCIYYFIIIRYTARDKHKLGRLKQKNLISLKFQLLRAFPQPNVQNNHRTHYYSFYTRPGAPEITTKTFILSWYSVFLIIIAFSFFFSNKRFKWNECTRTAALANTRRE